MPVRASFVVTIRIMKLLWDIIFSVKMNVCRRPRCLQTTKSKSNSVDVKSGAARVCLRTWHASSCADAPVMTTNKESAQMIDISRRSEGLRSSPLAALQTPACSGQTHELRVVGSGHMRAVTAGASLSTFTASLLLHATCQRSKQMGLPGTILVGCI